MKTMVSLRNRTKEGLEEEQALIQIMKIQIMIINLKRSSKLGRKMPGLPNWMKIMVIEKFRPAPWMGI